MSVLYYHVVPYGNKKNSFWPYDNVLYTLIPFLTILLWYTSVISFCTFLYLCIPLHILYYLVVPYGNKKNTFWPYYTLLYPLILLLYLFVPLDFLSSLIYPLPTCCTLWKQEKPFLTLIYPAVPSYTLVISFCSLLFLCHPLHILYHHVIPYRNKKTLFDHRVNKVVDNTQLYPVII